MAVKTIEIDCPPILFKIGKLCCLEKLVYKGQVYFGTLEGYRGQNLVDYENRVYISSFNKEKEFPNLEFHKIDPLECAQSIIYEPGDNIKINYHETHSHALSLFGFGPTVPLDFKLNEELKKFGDHVAIFNSKVFLNAIAQPLEEASASPKPVYGYVKFYHLEKGIDLHELTNFHKKIYYDYQYEYRIVANLQDNIVNIGDALKNNSDSMIIPTNELFETLKLQFS